MAKVLKHANIYTGSDYIDDGYIRFGDQIEAVGPMNEFKAQADDDIRVFNGATIVPGFIDVHCHGGYGYDSMDAKPADLVKMANLMKEHEGVTTLFPTTMTQSPSNINESMKNIKDAASETQLIKGIHLEGPFISKTFKGAQPEEFIVNPSIEKVSEWNKLSGGLIKLVTYAPENPGSKEFEDYLISNNIVASIGHSNALRKELIESKASHATHLYNAQREFKHREPGVTGHVLLEQNIIAELICDGFHIAPDMIKLAFEIKGADRIELITDSMRAKGIAEGESELGGQKVFVKDGQARLADGTLAGSVLKYIDAFRNIIKFTNCSIFEAVLMSSVNQAREFNLTQKGYLLPGYDADINILNEELELVKTYSYGK